MPNSALLDGLVPVSDHTAADGFRLQPVPQAVGTAGAALKVARGVATTASATDTIVTGLATVVSVIAVMQDNPSLTAMFVTASVGNQSGAPAAGSFLLNSWQPTSNVDGTPIAATAFSKKVNWFAIGT